MAPPVQDDWSDSDDEVLSEVETSVLLGVPDGPITTASDLTDAAVSRIGGHPVRLFFLHMYRLPIECNFNSSRRSFRQMNRLSLPLIANCVLNPWSFWFRCGAPLKIAQWIALSIYGDVQRALVKGNKGGKSCGCDLCKYIGMPSADGFMVSVRAWRGLRYNDKYAAKLEKKLARKREREQAKADAETQRKKQASQPNPFAVGLLMLHIIFILMTVDSYKPTAFQTRLGWVPRYLAMHPLLSLSPSKSLRMLATQKVTLVRPLRNRF